MFSNFSGMHTWMGSPGIIDVHYFRAQTAVSMGPDSLAASLEEESTRQREQDTTEVIYSPVSFPSGVQQNQEQIKSIYCTGIYKFNCLMNSLSRWLLPALNQNHSYLHVCTSLREASEGVARWSGIQKHPGGHSQIAFKERRCTERPSNSHRSSQVGNRMLLWQFCLTSFEEFAKDWTGNTCRWRGKAELQEIWKGLQVLWTWIPTT